MATIGEQSCLKLKFVSLAIISAYRPSPAVRSLLKQKL